MKILLNAIFTIFTFFSSINAQTYNYDNNLIVPKSQIKLDVTAEKVPGFFSNTEIESIVRLQLRRNNIPYLKPSERESALTGDYPYLYINLYVSKLKSGDIYGALRISLRRFNVFQISSFQKYDKDFRVIDLTNKDGRGPFQNIEAWSSVIYFYVPERYDQTKKLKETLISQIDEFSSKYIDLNNL